MPTNCLVFFPPQWTPTAPHLVGVIQSILKNNGHDTRLVDLNAEFYNSVLTPQYLCDAVKAAFADFEANARQYFEACPDEVGLKDRPREFQAEYRRYREIYKMAQRNEYRDVIRQIGAATAIYRDKSASTIRVASTPRCGLSKRPAECYRPSTTPRAFTS